MTEKGDAVFDPYIGGGSTAIAAVMHGRDAYGCDTSRHYIDIALDRIDRLEEGRLKTRPMGKPL